MWRRADGTDGEGGTDALGSMAWSTDGVSPRRHQLVIGLFARATGGCRAFHFRAESRTAPGKSRLASPAPGARAVSESRVRHGLRPILETRGAVRWLRRRRVPAGDLD